MAPVAARGLPDHALPDQALFAELASRAPADMKAFYAARAGRPLWLDDAGQAGPAVFALLDQVEQAQLDGIDPSGLRVSDLHRALGRAESGDPAWQARLELAASRVYANWVKALRGAPRSDMAYESEALAPVIPTTAAALEGAARSSRLDRFVAEMGWMHPYYAPLRAALLTGDYTDEQRRQIALNLDRVRALPADPGARYVLVDAAGARLWMFENGQPVDSMKVVVGKPDNQTPMMAGFLRTAILNPYWNVPDDLVRQRIATNVLAKGVGYLTGGGYQVLSGWDDDAAPVDPHLVDWHAVEEGREMVRVRQLPGGSNFMGRVKFMFPNALGIFLHDTPEKNLMLKDERTASSGCVRLEDAPRLGRWLMGRPLPGKLAGPEQPIALPEPVPVYITYLTVFPEAPGRLAFHVDPYGRDGEMPRLAAAER